MSGYPTCVVRRWDYFIGISIHDALIPPAPVPARLPHVSVGLVSGTQLFSQPSNGGKKDVLADGVHIMGRLGDAFPVVPHITAGVGYQPILPFTILFGSSTTCWGSGKVMLWTRSPIFGNSTADIGSYLAFMLAPHIACNEPISAPFDIAIGTNSTVQVGFGWGDLAACLIDIAVAIAVELVMKGAGDAVTTVTRKIKASKAVKQVAKLKVAAKQADEVAANAAKQIDAAKLYKSKVDDMYKSVKVKSARQQAVSDSAASAIDDAYKAYYKAAADKVNANKAVSSLSDTVSGRADVVKKLASQQTDAIEKYAKGELTDEAYAALRKQIDTELAQAKKLYNKALENLADAGDNSLSSIWKRIQTKEESKAIDIVTERSKYVSWLDYAAIYGTPSGGFKAVMTDPKTIFTVGLYPLFKMLKSGTDEYVGTMAAWAGKTYLYAASRYITTGTKKIISKSWKRSKDSFASEDKNFLYISKWWGKSRLDYIEEFEGIDEEDEVYVLGDETGRFDWVDAGANADTNTKERFTWAAANAASASDGHWADKSYVKGTTSRWGWADELQAELEAESSTETAAGGSSS